LLLQIGHGSVAPLLSLIVTGCMTVGYAVELTITAAGEPG
jgi:hypothetical protein